MMQSAVISTLAVIFVQSNCRSLMTCTAALHHGALWGVVEYCGRFKLHRLDIEF